ncbi:MAG: polyisoprenoid-binding protein YceI [Candidatus Woesearchaeota archaeon]|jgi:polyisoprenoid-binding protein YceI
MKYLTLFLLLVVVLFTACSKPPDDVPSAQLELNIVEEIEPTLEPKVAVSRDVPVDIESSSFTFTGYGPGKEHIGSFDIYNGHLVIEKNTVIGLAGVINTSSVNTGIDGLNTHLQSEDFFDAANNPFITVANGVVLRDGDLVQARADVTLNGITQSIVFPVITSENSIAADFLLDGSLFEIEYIGVNKDVRIMFTFRI